MEALKYTQNKIIFVTFSTNVLKYDNIVNCFFNNIEIFVIPNN